MENRHNITIFDRELAKKTNLVDFQQLFSKDKTIILANFQKIKNKKHCDTHISRISSETGKVRSFFSLRSKRGQLRYSYTRYPWVTLYDTMIQISFCVGTLKYVPS